MIIHVRCLLASARGIARDLPLFFSSSSCTSPFDLTVGVAFIFLLSYVLWVFLLHVLDATIRYTVPDAAIRYTVHRGRVAS